LLKGKSIAVRQGTSDWTSLQALGFNAELVDSVNPATDVMSTKTVSGVLGNGYFLDQQYPTYCDLKALLPALKPDPYAYAIRNDIAPLFMPYINNALLQLQNTGVTDTLIQAQRGSKCPTITKKVKEDTTLTPSSFYGLWCILLAVTGFLGLSQLAEDYLCPDYSKGLGNDKVESAVGSEEGSMTSEDKGRVMMRLARLEKEAGLHEPVRLEKEAGLHESVPVIGALNSSAGDNGDGILSNQLEISVVLTPVWSGPV